MLIVGPSSGGANEILASAPKPGDDFLCQCADYLNDRFAFRQELITAWSLINAKVFRTSAEDKVILGKDGWLFYADDYSDQLSEQELESVAVNIKNLQNDIEDRGGRFIFTIAPDKTTVFSEKLVNPDYPKNSNADRLKKYLEDYGINYISLFELDIPYYATDSHWTDAGAAVAADAMLGTDYADGAFYISGKHTGDLYEMLYPAFSENEERIEYAPGFSFTCEKDPHGGDAITIHTYNESADGSLFCWRDSFGISLYPYLAETFGEATFTRSSDYDASKTGEADTVILEIVERNIGKLK